MEMEKKEKKYFFRALPLPYVLVGDYTGRPHKLIYPS
jgi:hypothetical protein